MADIDSNQLRRLDMTLLLVFLGLMRRRKATEVAAELGLTQSAVSHALRRLRDVFGDELFLRRPHGLEPTAVATAAEPQVRAAIEGLRGALAGPRAFDPAAAEGLIRITAYDAEMATLVPGLICRLARDAPGLRIAARSIGRRDALDLLAAGEADLALGYFWNVGPTFVVTPLYEEEYLVVGSRSRETLRGRLTLDRYLALPHILVSPGGDMRGIVDSLLEREGRERRVIAAVPLFFPALAAVRDSRAIATLPKRIATAYADAFGLSIAVPPLSIRAFTVSAVRHRRNESSPVHLWLTNILCDLAEPEPRTPRKAVASKRPAGKRTAV